MKGGGGGGGGPTETQISVPDELQPLFAQFTNQLPPLVGAGGDVMKELYRSGHFAAPLSAGENLYGDILNQLIQQRLFPQLNQAAQVLQPVDITPNVGDPRAVDRIVNPGAFAPPPAPAQPPPATPPPAMPPGSAPGSAPANPYLRGGQYYIDSSEPV